MAPAVEDPGHDHAAHPSGRFAGDGPPSQACSSFWFAELMKSDCCSPSPQATTLTVKGQTEGEGGDPSAARSKGASSLPHWMDPSRVLGQTGEKVAKVETSSPGPSTPMQVPPLPQLKPKGLTPESYTIVTSASMAQAFQPMKPIWGSQAVARARLAASASTQDPSQSQKENALALAPRSVQSFPKSASPVPATHLRVRHPQLGRALATLGTPKTPLVNDDLQLHLHSKRLHSEPGNSSFGAASGRPSSGSKAEAHKYLVDAGLSLGFNPPPQNPGLNRTPSGQSSQQRWESGTPSGGQAGLSFAPVTPNEGFTFLQLSQGAAVNAQVGSSEEDRKGQRDDASLTGDAAERSLSQGQEPFLAVRGDPLTDLSHERPKKRMKRRMLDPTITSYEARERTLDMDEEQDSEKNLKVSDDHEDSGSSHSADGLLPPPSAPHGPLREASVHDQVFAKILEMPIVVPKTVVVKKTPKRVHNSDPNAPLTRNGLSMLEGLEVAMSAKSPQTAAAHLMFTPSTTAPGGNLRSATDMQGGELPVLASSRDAHEGGAGVWQPLPGSRLYTVSAYSPMPTRTQTTFAAGEPSLPLTLNFSPKLSSGLLPMGSNPKVCTGMPATGEEWGKSLALSATPTEMVESRTPQAKPALSYQERFKQLQVFLRRCDEDDQTDLLHALRSLSAAARSGHAVGLEQRAMLLSIEEGKEMARVKALNIMGQKSHPPGGPAAGCTPQGPRLPAFSTPTGSAAPSRMRMLMSGPRPHVATPNFT